MVEEVETPPLQQEWYEPAELRDVRMEMKVTPSMEEQRQRERVNAPHGPEATKGSPKEPIKPLTPEIQELLTQISKSGLPKMMHGGQPLPMQASASSSQPQMQVQSMAPPSSIVYTPTTGLPLPIISMPATTMPAPQQLPWQHQHQQQHQGAQYDQMCQFFRTKRVSAVKGFLHSFPFSSLLSDFLLLLLLSFHVEEEEDDDEEEEEEEGEDEEEVVGTGTRSSSHFRLGSLHFGFAQVCLGCG